jgi:hypothetical protein
MRIARIFLFLLMVSSTAAFAQTLATPVISMSTAIFSAGAFTPIGTSQTYPNPVKIQFIPSNLAAWQAGATAQTVCWEFGGGIPTASTPGTCDPPANTYVAFPVSAGTPYNNIAVNGTVTVCAIGTAAGFTNSASTCSNIIIQSFRPSPAVSGLTLGAYSYSPLVVTMNCAYVGGVNPSCIYTTDASTPTVSSGCTPSGTSTSVANNSSITLPNSAQTTVKAMPCVSGTTGSIQTGVYTQQAQKNWFIRPGGGSRFSSNVTTGQCNGMFDADYPGTGTNQNCAFNDVRYMWMDGSFGNSQWVMAGGDTLVIRGCTALAGQQNPDNPHCRVGLDNANATGIFCQGVSQPWGCDMAPPPDGSVSQNTKILGQCAFGTYTCTPILNQYPLGTINETQLFAGWASGALMWFKGSSNITVEGLELTTHNGACTTRGAPAFPSSCSVSVPVSDFGHWGVLMDQTSGNFLFQDVYVHGFSELGFGGALGGNVKLTRVQSNFNVFAGWNFDDGNATPDAINASLVQSYITMIGNGCMEEYPIVHTQFPALSCWDPNSGGFGDSWSGQASLLGDPTNIEPWSCDHCLIEYNTKDGAMGPHTLLSSLSITNTTWIGNEGAQWKWGMQQSSNTVATNNSVLGNCQALGAQVPGASQSFNLSTAANGAYLSDFCRAGPVLGAYFADANSSVLFNNNTFVTYANTVLELGCGTVGACTGSASYNFNNNIFLGYTVPTGYIPGGNGSPPGVFFFDTAVSMNCANNIGFGIRNITPCTTTTIANVDPLFVSEPAQGSVPPESSLYGFNFNLTSGSPAINAGTTPCPTVDQNGNTQTSPCTIGPLVFNSTPTVATPTASPTPGTYSVTQSVTLSDATSGATICWANSPATPSATTPGTCDVGSNTYTAAISVPSTTTIKALGTKSGFTNSSVASFAYTITPVTCVTMRLQGVKLLGISVQGCSP